jgi:hypothetical protein
LDGKPVSEVYYLDAVIDTMRDSGDQSDLGTDQSSGILLSVSCFVQSELTDDGSYQGTEVVDFQTDARGLFVARGHWVFESLGTFFTNGARSHIDRTIRIELLFKDAAKRETMQFRLYVEGRLIREFRYLDEFITEVTSATERFRSNMSDDEIADNVVYRICISELGRCYNVIKRRLQGDCAIIGNLA